MLIPTVIDKTPSGERAFDIFSRLLDDRIVFVSGEIDDNLCNTVIAQLLYLESKDNKKDIHLYINSPGGILQSGLAILDTMNYIASEVSTIGIGLCASAAALLLAGGAKGKRFVLPHTKVMIHQPWGSAKGQISEIEIYYREGIKDKKTYAELIGKYSNREIEKVLKDIDRDNYLTAQEAIDYGLVDKILEKIN